MDPDDELVNEIWISDNFTTVTFSKDGTRFMANSFRDKNNELPKGLIFILWQKRLKIPKSKREILIATPGQLQEWIV